MTDDTRKTRPSKGAMWWQQMTDEFFDIDFENVFEGESSNARNIELCICAFIAKNWDKKVRTCVIEVRLSTFIDKLNDESIDLNNIKDISQKLLVLNRIDQFQVLKKSKTTKLLYEVKSMLPRLDNYNKQEILKENRLDEIRVMGESLGIPHSINDSTLDEFIEYVYIKRHGTKKQKDSQLSNDVFEEYLKKSSKIEQHTGKENTEHIGLSNNGSNNNINNKTSSPQASSDKGSDDDINPFAFGEQVQRETEESNKKYDEIMNNK